MRTASRPTARSRHGARLGAVRRREGRAGNRVATTFTLATDVDDPVERLRVIHEGMVDVKEQQKAIGADTLTDWAEFAAPAVAGRAARLYSRTKIADGIGRCST